MRNVEFMNLMRVPTRMFSSDFQKQFISAASVDGAPVEFWDTRCDHAGCCGWVPLRNTTMIPRCFSDGCAYRLAPSWDGYKDLDLSNKLEQTFRALPEEVQKGIKQAHEDGAPVQLLDGNGVWIIVATPAFRPGNCYRVYPDWKKTPDSPAPTTPADTIDKPVFDEWGTLLVRGVEGPNQMTYASNYKSFVGYIYAGGTCRPILDRGADGTNVPVAVRFRKT